MTVELFEKDPYLRACDATAESVDTEKKCFSANQTVFYPEGGGQPGDTGFAYFADKDLLRTVEIVDTRRDRKSGQIQHFAKTEEELPAAGAQMHLELDWDRRYELMKMHSCLHLLCAVIPSRITGCQVYEGRGRIDFDTTDPLDKEQLTYRLNLLIQENANRKNLVVTRDELEADAELANSFSVPAPKNVKLVNLVHFEGIDIQPCGGTHVANTREIGDVTIKKIVNKGKHNRRVTVVLD